MTEGEIECEKTGLGKTQIEDNKAPSPVPSLASVKYEVAQSFPHYDAVRGSTRSIETKKGDFRRKDKKRHYQVTPSGEVLETIRVLGGPPG